MPETQGYDEPRDGVQEHEPDEQTQRGLLAPIGDPLGKALGTALHPVGVVTETITKPVISAVGSITRPVLGPIAGHHDEKMEILGGGDKDSYRVKEESIGGNNQTADNPLGLDQTGKWGFRE